MTLRILHVATRHRVGGAERNLVHTISRQLERGFDVHVAVGTRDLHHDFPARTRVHPLPDLVREVSPGTDRRALSGLRGLIRAHGFDVVHTHQSKAGALGRVAARRLTPVVVHTVHMASFGPAYGRGRSAVFLALERWLARFTDKFVFVGTELERRYLAARVVSANRSMIVRSPIMNLESLIAVRRSRANPRRQARAAIGVSADRRVVLMVGALDRRKRHALAISALSPLLAERKTQVVIAGQGPERGALERLCSRLGIADWVTFVGFIHDITPLYAAADVLVQASSLEGVPQTVVQAVAAGVPAIATEVDGVREAAPNMPHVSVLPPDGRGLLEIVRNRLDGPALPPAAPELVAQWLPKTVDVDLGELHDWMEERVALRRPPLDASRCVPTPRAPTLPTEEPAIR